MWYQDPKAWIAIAFFTFFVLFGRKIGALIATSLDARSARIAQELREAETLRREAEETLARYQQKYQESMKEAEEIIQRARQSAEAMLTQAESDLKEAMQRRTRQAMERIAEEEKLAVQEVRGHVVDITVAAARTIVIEQLQHMAGDEVVRQVIADIERKVH